MLEWVMMGVAASQLDSRQAGQAPAVRVETHAGEITTPEAKVAASEVGELPVADLTGADRDWVERGRRWLVSAPDTSLAQRPAVLSVSALKQQASRAGGEDVPRDLDLRAPLRVPRFAQATVGEDGLMVGSAYHQFMRHAELSCLGSLKDVRAQVAQFVADGRLSEEEVGLLSCEDIVWLASTDEGRLLTQYAQTCRREVPFVYALPAGGQTERTVLRGVIDCLLETDDGLLILDYKTDRLTDATAWEHRISGYRVQLQLYALAARGVFGRPVAGTILIFVRQRRVVPVPAVPPPLDTVWACVGGTGEPG
jgi:ATP-dependent helicase/nuclease subunit A